MEAVLIIWGLLAGALVVNEVSDMKEPEILSCKKSIVNTGKSKVEIVECEPSEPTKLYIKKKVRSKAYQR